MVPDREETSPESLYSWASRESPIVSRMASFFPTSDKAGSVSISQFPLCLSPSLPPSPQPLSRSNIPRFVVRDFFLSPPSFSPESSLLDLLPAQSTPHLPPGHHRLFKIPAGVPSSVLKITPTRLVCRFEPSLVDCDIAPTLLHASSSPSPRLPERTLSLSLSSSPPYFIRPLSTFPLPPGFCLAPTSCCLPPPIAPLLVPFSRLTYPISSLLSGQGRRLEEEGGTFFSLAQFFETFPPSLLLPPPSPLFLTPINTNGVTVKGVATSPRGGNYDFLAGNHSFSFARAVNAVNVGETMLTRNCATSRFS